MSTLTGTTHLPVASSRPAAGSLAGRAAAVIGTPYALLNLYWAAGGTDLLSRYGSHVVGRAVPGDSAFRVTSAVIAVLMVVAIGSGLRATGTTGGTQLDRWAGWLSAGWLALYGGAMTFIGVTVPLALYGDTPGIDADLYRWHTLLWDPWFLIWGLVLAAGLSRSAARSQTWMAR